MSCDSTYNSGRGEWLHCNGEHLRGNFLRGDGIVHQQRYGGIAWTWYSDEADRTRHFRGCSMTARPYEVTDRSGASDTEFAAVLARFDGEGAPESDDPALWGTLCDLIPCNDFVGCGDECECAEGELRLAIMRLVIVERAHHADCGDDEDCCNATDHRARLVNKAANLTAERLRARRLALRGEPQ